MIRIKIQTKNKQFQKITFRGHAFYDDYGKDIVCASVSSIVTTSINAILRFDNGTIDYESKEGLVKIDILKEDETTRKLIDNMIALLEELASDYPKNIKVERE